MTLLQDVRYACRLLIKDPWFTLVAALALGLGIGVNTTVFTFVNAVLIRGLPFDQPDEILYLNGAEHLRRETIAASPSWISRTGAPRRTRFKAWRSSQQMTMNVSESGRPAERFVRCERLGEHVPAAASATAPRPRLCPGEDRPKRRAGRHPRLLGLEEPIRQRPGDPRHDDQDQRHRVTSHRRHAGGHAIPHQRRRLDVRSWPRTTC